MIVTAGVVAVLATVFVVYPRLVFRTIVTALRGFIDLVADCIAVLLAWI